MTPKKSAKEKAPVPTREAPQAEVMKTYTVGLDDLAEADLDTISDQRTVGTILRRVQALATEPAVQGKALTGDLQGYRSIRAAGQRYRVIYEVIEAQTAVEIVVIGIRREGHKSDAYEIAEKRLT